MLLNHPSFCAFEYIHLGGPLRVACASRHASKNMMDAHCWKKRRSRSACMLACCAVISCGHGELVILQQRPRKLWTRTRTATLGPSVGRVVVVTQDGFSWQMFGFQRLLCWAPSDRQEPPQFLRILRGKLYRVMREHFDLREVIFKLAAVATTFALSRLRLFRRPGSWFFRSWRKQAPSRARVKDKGQPFYLRALEEWLRLCGDPDWRIVCSSKKSFAKGVSVGVDCKTPRNHEGSREAWRVPSMGPTWQ